MTIIDATNKLFDWFSDNDSFCMADDFQKLVLVTESRERDESSIKLALQNLQESHLVKQDGNYWILNRPFQQWEQSVGINGPVSTAISKTINDFCDLIDDQTDRCDASDLKEKDIRNIVIISEHYKNLYTDSLESE